MTQMLKQDVSSQLGQYAKRFRTTSDMSALLCFSPSLQRFSSGLAKWEHAHSFTCCKMADKIVRTQRHRAKHDNTPRNWCIYGEMEAFLQIYKPNIQQVCKSMLFLDPGGQLTPENTQLCSHLILQLPPSSFSVCADNNLLSNAGRVSCNDGY